MSSSRLATILAFAGSTLLVAGAGAQGAASAFPWDAQTQPEWVGSARDAKAADVEMG